MMELKQVSENCYYSTYEKERDRCCIGYIKTSENSAICIDAGASQGHFAEFAKLLEFSRLPLPTSCILTHSHWDHVMGLGCYDMPTYALSKTKFYMETFNKDLIKKWRKIESSDLLQSLVEYGSLTNEEKFCLECMGKEYFNNPDFVKFHMPNVIISENENSSLTTYKGTVEFFHCPYSLHSDDSLFILHKEEKILFVGDGLYENFNLDIIHDSKWLETRLPLVKKMREFIMNIDFEYCVMGHSFAKTKDETIDYIDSHLFTI